MKKNQSKSNLISQSNPFSDRVKYHVSKLKKLDELGKIRYALAHHTNLAFQEARKITDLNKPKKEKKREFEENMDVIAVTSITIEWDDITFAEGSIAVRYQKQSLKKFSIKNSKKSLNTIKSHYKFRNAPKLTLEICQNKILRIINIEVLFYYIQFLENAGSQFKIQLSRPASIFDKYKIYTKSYYKKHLSELFQPECFNLLCEFSDSDLPIIPVPEAVISANGVEQIHDSFLFPLVRGMSIYWYWESIEESKATYLFKTSSTGFELKLQTVFDYLTGDTVNKRETLIRDHRLQRQLGYVTRIYHNDLNLWSNEVKGYSNDY